MRSASTTNSTTCGSYYNCESQKRSSWLGSTCFLDELQLLWFATHALTIISFIVYSFIYMGARETFLSRIPWYRVSNYSCIITYSVVIYKRYLCKQKIENNINESVLISYVLKTENVQLIICASLWCFTKESVFKLFPFFTYSFLNIACFFVFEIYPEAPFSVALAPLICYIREPLLVSSGIVDIINIGILAFEAFHSKSVYSLFLYTFVWGLKIENSEASRIALYKFLNLFEILFINTYIPSQIQNKWNDLKYQLSVAKKSSSNINAKKN